jgi:predicted CXXCH cytochrome family protein
MRRMRWFMLATLAGGAVLSGCVDERIVFVERPLFDAPPPAAGEFVGYSNPDTKLTVCGACHAGVQVEWRGTAHANAWATLQAAPGKQAFCESCHTTNSLGNPVEGVQGGWAGAQVARYQDVQCESCHGPSLDHIRTPDRTNWPLAPMQVGLNLDRGCGQCHSGAHQPFVEEWARSRHGRATAAAPGNVATTAVGNRPECKGCHTGEDALEYWGIRANFLEKGAMQQPGQHLPITCGVCHDPHANAVEGQLRFSVTVASEEENLCMKCHHKRGNPDPTTFRGPHSPEGPMLLGYAGNWFPPMEFPDTIIATHGTERNPRLCAGCHVNQFTVRDQLTGQFNVASVGHTFEATPCVNAEGVPVPGPCSINQQTFKTCTDAGCHGSENAARSLQIRAEERLLRLTDELDALLRQIQPNWKQCRGSGTCPGEFHGSDGRWTVAEGAAFNYELSRAISGPRVNEIRFGAAVHNPVLTEVLLLTSIREVRRQYSLGAQTSVSLEPVFGVAAR